MKRFFTVLAFISFAGFCSATEILDNDWDTSTAEKSGLYLEAGYSNYVTHRLDFDHYNITDNAQPTRAFGFSGEIGTFKSPEDNLVDFVELSTFGLAHGRMGTNGKYSWLNDGEKYTADADAIYTDIYLKYIGGPQINFGLFSVGGMLGTRLGFNWMEMSTLNSKNDINKYKDNKVYFDMVLMPYVSANIADIAKLMLGADFLVPIVRARFIKEPKTEDYIFHISWFKNDLPVTFRAGIVIFVD